MLLVRFRDYRRMKLEGFGWQLFDFCTSTASRVLHRKQFRPLLLCKVKTRAPSMSLTSGRKLARDKWLARVSKYHASTLQSKIRHIKEKQSKSNQITERSSSLRLFLRLPALPDTLPNRFQKAPSFSFLFESYESIESIDFRHFEDLFDDLSDIPIILGCGRMPIFIRHMRRRSV
jgi:hypothetical protein